MNNPKDFYLHSGGAKGADTVWDDMALEFGIPKEHIRHWRPEDYHEAIWHTKEEVDHYVKLACKALGRPFQPDKSYYPLIARDYFQAFYSDGIFAIGRVLLPGERGARDFENKSGKQVVDGGTGYAVEMAIQMNKPVFVFDMRTEGLLANKWWMWTPNLNKFVVFHELSKTPALTKSFAGIGSREITEEGIQAIRDVYTKTFRQ